MTPMQVVFLLIAAATLFSGVMAVSSRKIMHAALWLVLALLGVAGLFAMLEAGFFVVIQVMVYIGAIAILIIFAVMLTRKAMEDTGPQTNRGWWIAAIIAGGLTIGMIVILGGWSGFNKLSGPAAFNGMDIAGLGKAFVDPNGFMLPFEVASVLLLAALVGGIYVAMERRGGKG
jgi:NADH-quinone oxidoreductase subunit J